MTRLLYYIMGLALLGLTCSIWMKLHSPPQEACRECPEPVPREADHVAAVMRHEDGSGSIQDRFDSDHEFMLIKSGHHVFDFSIKFPKGAFWVFCDEQRDCRITVPPTYDVLKRAGVEIVCENAFGKVPSVNYWDQEVPMACSKLREVRVTNKNIKITTTKEKP
jgi:hypothetical protein